MSKTTWFIRERRHLGTVPDRVIAERNNMSTTAVKAARRKAGIPGLRKITLVHWTQAVLRQLGTVPDSAIAEKLGCSIGSVSFKRRELSIPAMHQHNQVLRKDLAPRFLKQLGKRPDADIAAAAGVNIKLIKVHRLALGISSYRSVKHKPIPESVIARLGTMGDAKLAKKTKIAPARIRHERLRRKIPPFRSPISWDVITPLLGEETDASLSRRFAISKAALQVKRKCLNIPAASRVGLRRKRPL